MIELKDEDMDLIDSLVSSHTVVGDRFPAFAMGMTDL